LTADADEGAVDLIAGRALRLLDGAGDRPNRLLDVDDDGFLETRRRHNSLADDSQAAIAPHLTDERANFARTDVDSDQYRFAFHSLVLGLVLRSVSLILTDPAASDRGSSTTAVHRAM
jgi:hypothetical protein